MEIRTAEKIAKVLGVQPIVLSGIDATVIGVSKQVNGAVRIRPSDWNTQCHTPMTAVGDLTLTEGA
jgi:hypothetical protein